MASRQQSWLQIYHLSLYKAYTAASDIGTLQLVNALQFKTSNAYFGHFIATYVQSMKLLKKGCDLLAAALEEYFWMLTSTLDLVKSNTSDPKGPTKAGAFFKINDIIESNNRSDHNK